MPGFGHLAMAEGLDNNRACPRADRIATRRVARDPRAPIPAVPSPSTKEPLAMRLTSLLLATVLSALATITANAQVLDGTLKTIKDTGAITLAYRETSVPFSFLGDNQKPVGFAIDICLTIVEAVKSTLKLDRLDIHYGFPRK